MGAFKEIISNMRMTPATRENAGQVVRLLQGSGPTALKVPDALSNLSDWAKVLSGTADTVEIPRYGVVPRMGIEGVEKFPGVLAAMASQRLYPNSLSAMTYMPEELRDEVSGVFFPNVRTISLAPKFSFSWPETFLHEYGHALDASGAFGPEEKAALERRLALLRKEEMIRIFGDDPRYRKEYATIQHTDLPIYTDPQHPFNQSAPIRKVLQNTGKSFEEFSRESQRAEAIAEYYAQLQKEKLEEALSKEIGLSPWNTTEEGYGG